MFEVRGLVYECSVFCADGYVDWKTVLVLVWGICDGAVFSMFESWLNHCGYCDGCIGRLRGIQHSTP